MTSGASVKRQVGDDPEGKGLRHSADFYRTGEVATRALLAVEQFAGIVWECACGAGDMARVLERRCDRVLSSDLYDYGYGESGIDFLVSGLPLGVENIVTNPPFRQVDEFVLHALALDPANSLESARWYRSRLCELVMGEARLPMAERRATRVYDQLVYTLTTEEIARLDGAG